MFLMMFFKTQNIVPTMHLTMLIAHPYCWGLCMRQESHFHLEENLLICCEMEFLLATPLYRKQSAANIFWNVWNNRGKAK